MEDKKIVRASLGMLVRLEKIVNVEVPADFDAWPEARKASVLKSVADSEDRRGYATDASHPKVDSHRVLDGASTREPDFRVDDDGKVVPVVRPQLEDETVLEGLRAVSRPPTLR